MRSIKTEIIIEASVEKIWRVLMDFTAYAHWNPFIRSIEGRAAVGERLTVSIQPPQQKVMTFRYTVITVKPYEEFAWKGILLIPGLFNGTHRFILEKLPNNHTRFVQAEIFTGLLHLPIFSMIGKSTEKGFQLMNQALKEQNKIS